MALDVKIAPCHLDYTWHTHYCVYPPTSPLIQFTVSGPNKNKNSVCAVKISVHCHKSPCGKHRTPPWKQSPTCLWVFSHLYSQWPVRRAPQWLKCTSKTRWQGRHKDPRCLFASSGCIQGITAWLMGGNQKSQVSQREQWFRFKQRSAAVSARRRQLRQMDTWNSCASKLIGCAASSLTTPSPWRTLR